MTAIDPDDFIDLARADPLSPAEGRAAWDRAYAALETALAQAGPAAELFVVFGIQAGGKSTWVRDAGRTAPDHTVFFSGPLPSRGHRERVLGIARRAACAVTAVWITAPLDEALRRNARRRGLARVPDHVIHHVHERLEAPSRDEGFDRILVVDGSAGPA